MDHTDTVTVTSSSSTLDATIDGPRPMVGVRVGPTADARNSLIGVRSIYDVVEFTPQPALRRAVAGVRRLQHQQLHFCREQRSFWPQLPSTRFSVTDVVHSHGVRDYERMARNAELPALSAAAQEIHHHNDEDYFLFITRTLIIGLLALTAESAADDRETTVSKNSARP